MKKALLLVLTLLTQINFAQTCTVAVFCSADNKVSPVFKTAAFNLGTLLGKHGFGLVTGGSQTGLMKEVVDGYTKTSDSRKNLFGVMPEVLKPYDVHHKKISEKNFIWVSDMQTRLNTFHSLSNALIILPGGFGTLHELLDFLVHCQFDLIKKIPIILCNLDGYWNNFMQQLAVMEEHSLLHKKHLAMITLANTEQECFDILCHLTNTSFHDHHGLDSLYWENN